MKNYNHLSEEERDNIFIMLQRKKSINEIARTLRRSKSSISREIKKNFGRNRYRAHTAHDRAISNQHNLHKKERLKSHALRIEVESMLNKRWSPEIISGRLKLQTNLPTISPESIYQWIYADANYLIGYLIRSHPTRWPKHKSKNKRYIIPDRVDISSRPVSINERTEPGHWEADLIIGSGQAVIQVIVERKTRVSKLLKIINKTAQVSSTAICSILSTMPAIMKQSITYDNGLENSEHTLINNQFNMYSYFCQPYHAWEKGTVENTNGLIRIFLPKKTNFDNILDSDIQQVESWLNDRPRKCLDFRTPAECFNSLCCT